jgi:hypothetical protein
MGRTSIVLVVVALGLLGFIFLFERGSLSTTERELRKSRVVDNFVRDKVTRLELQRRGVTTVLVKVEPNPADPLDLGGWQVEAPYKAKADSTEVDSLLGALEWAEARRSLGEASAADRKTFGLDAPRYRLRFVAGREEGGFSVGARAADGQGAYLTPRASKAVFVVGPDLLDALEHEPEEFHAKILHDGLTILTAQQLELHRGSQALKLARKDGFFWLDGALASQSELKALIDVLDGLRATRYVGEQVKPEHALDQPRLAVELDSLVYDPAQKGKQHTERFSLKVGAVCGKRDAESYIQVGQRVYCASNAELAKLERTPEQLRETRVLPLDDDDISGVELRAGERVLTLTTVENATRYEMVEAGSGSGSGSGKRAGEADRDALKEWYGALRGLRFSSAPSAETAVAPTAVTATFKRSGKDEAPYVLHVDPSGLKAARLDEKVLLELPPSAAELLTPMAARFRKKRVLDEDESQLSAIAISGTGRAAERVEKHGSDYELVAAQRSPAARRPLDELARLFSKLDALSFEADHAKPEHGLSAPYRTLQIEYAGSPDGKTKARKHTLSIGAAAADKGRYARLNDDPAVFVLPNALVSKLDASLATASAQ